MDYLERLFREYHGPVVRYLTRRLGDRDLAEELAQETFLRAMRHGPVARERAWLFAVATNLVRDEARRDARERKRLQLIKDQVDAEGPPEPEAVTADRLADQLREQALAREAVDALAERDRMALLLREEGLDYHEIAAALGLSVGSVGTTLSRARRRLVEVYEALQRARTGDRAAKEGSGVA
jgi:RNA polymerase sigma-70 factor, ECF subfamily